MLYCCYLSISIGKTTILECCVCNVNELLQIRIVLIFNLYSHSEIILLNMQIFCRLIMEDHAYIIQLYNDKENQLSFFLSIKCSRRLAQQSNSAIQQKRLFLTFHVFVKHFDEYKLFVTQNVKFVSMHLITFFCILSAHYIIGVFVNRRRCCFLLNY